MGRFQSNSAVGNQQCNSDAGVWIQLSQGLRKFIDLHVDPNPKPWANNVPRGAWWVSWKTPLHLFYPHFFSHHRKRLWCAFIYFMVFFDLKMSGETEWCFGLFRKTMHFILFRLENILLGYGPAQMLQKLEFSIQSHRDSHTGLRGM